MLSKYEKKAIFEILKKQACHHYHWQNPADNPLESAAELFWDTVCEDGVMHINKIKYPDLRQTPLWYVWPCIYMDVAIIHHLFDDVYNEETATMVESMCNGKLEGVYFFENIAIKPGDNVIDAGAFIGDWSAVAASTMGGNVYAFEPSTDKLTTELIERTAKLNNFKYVQKGLGDTVGRGMLRTDIQRGEQQISRDGIVGSGVYCDMTTVDAFAAENNIKIDFIKSDIEGYERYMLRGAEYVLKNHQPKLSLKIYHNNYEDAYVLPEIISSINPNYKMIMRKNVMYAYV